MEAAEIQPETVKQMRVEVLVPSRKAKVCVTTLEEQVYELDWTV